MLHRGSQRSNKHNDSIVPKQRTAISTLAAASLAIPGRDCGISGQISRGWSSCGRRGCLISLSLTERTTTHTPIPARVIIIMTAVLVATAELLIPDDHP